MDGTVDTSRCGFMAGAGALGAAGLLAAGAAPEVVRAAPGPGGAFWPNGARLVISVSRQFEAGGQPPKNTDSLYEEGATRRRMMSISAHDRISGTPQMVRVWDEFLRYARSHPGVAFMRKDEIARHALGSPLTVRETETI